MGTQGSEEGRDECCFGKDWWGLVFVCISQSAFIVASGKTCRFSIHLEIIVKILYLSSLEETNYFIYSYQFFKVNWCDIYLCF